MFDRFQDVSFAKQGLKGLMKSNLMPGKEDDLSALRTESNCGFG